MPTGVTGRLGVMFSISVSLATLVFFFGVLYGQQVQNTKTLEDRSKYLDKINKLEQDVHELQSEMLNTPRAQKQEQAE